MSGIILFTCCRRAYLRRTIIGFGEAAAKVHVMGLGMVKQGLGFHPIYYSKTVQPAIKWSHQLDVLAHHSTAIT